MLAVAASVEPTVMSPSASTVRASAKPPMRLSTVGVTVAVALVTAADTGRKPADAAKPLAFTVALSVETALIWTSPATSSSTGSA